MENKKFLELLKKLSLVYNIAILAPLVIVKSKEKYNKWCRYFKSNI